MKEKIEPSHKIHNIQWNNYLSPKREGDSYEEGTSTKNPYEIDLESVIYCPAVRRMHDKTQVIPLTNGDTIITRLTHSIIVMNIAERICNEYCRSSDFKSSYGEQSNDIHTNISAICRAAAFVHDIGNPPFGHFGEVAIRDFFGDFLKKNLQVNPKQKLDLNEFDGNALGLRILSKLQYSGDLYGLNLTYSTLGAYMKYPNPGNPDDKYIGTKKHGVFTTEESLFNNIVCNCNLKTPSGRIKRHPLSFIVEAADTIGYRAMDLEDGFNLHWYSYHDIIDHVNHYITRNSHEKRDIEKILNISSSKKWGERKKNACIQTIVDRLPY